MAPDVVLSLYPALLHSVIRLLLIKAFHFSMRGMQYVLDSDVRHVYSFQCGRPKFKSELSVPLLKAANSWLLSYLLLSQTPQTIINTTFCQKQPSAMVCVLNIHSHV